MDQNERRVIDELFGKLRQVEGQTPRRDPEAEAHIGRQVASLPTAPYYMAQAILVQEQALASLQSRVQQLEQQLAQRPAAGSGGGFLSGIFGGGQSSQPLPRQPVQPQHVPPSHMQPGYGGHGHGSPWGGGHHGGTGMGGGGFLAGAMQTALGVAGGVLVADAISDAFGGGAAEAGELAAGAADQAGEALGADQGAVEADPVAFEDPGFDAGGDLGGEEEV
jgi:uncharacterized protein